MFVVRELDRELPLIFWFRRLPRAVRFSEREASVFARRCAQVTDRANRWARAGEGLSREKLLAMTAHTGVVIGEVCDVRKISLRRPGGGNFVAGVARQASMLFRRMQEVGVLRG